MESYWQTAEGKADENLWLDQFADQIPVLDLPTVQNRPALRTYVGRRYDHRLSAELVEKIRRVGAKSGCSLFNAMLAAFSRSEERRVGKEGCCSGGARGGGGDAQ